MLLLILVFEESGGWLIDVNETHVCLITLMAKSISWACVKSSSIQSAFLHIFISCQDMLQLLFKKTLLINGNEIIYSDSVIGFAGYLLVPPDSMAPVNYLCQ